MSNNDLITARNEILRELNDINSSGRLNNEDYSELFDTINREFLVLLKRFRKEMSAKELYNTYLQICKEYSGKGKPIRCYECPFYIAICPRMGWALRLVVKFAPIVERWAQNHSEKEERG